MGFGLIYILFIYKVDKKSYVANIPNCRVHAMSVFFMCSPINSGAVWSHTVLKNDFFVLFVFSPSTPGYSSKIDDT